MKKVISTLIASAVAVSGLSAWELIDNFQAWEDGAIYENATDIGWHATALEGTDQYWMFADPADPTGENICMYVESGNYGVGYGDTWAMKALPSGGIEPGEIGTIYFRCLWSDLGNNWHFGTADKDLAYDELSGMQTTPGTWNDYNALIRLGDAKAIEHRNGSAYVGTNPAKTVVANVWYHFWMVVDNTWNLSVSPPESTGKYTLYMQGPDFGDGNSPTLVPVGTEPPKDDALLRRTPKDEDGNPRAIIWAMFATNSGPSGGPNPGDPFLLDDFYFAKGVKDLTIPSGEEPPKSWGGYPWANDAGDVDTGSWMGWINVKSAPYIFSYTLGWIYMPEPTPTAVGAWGYVYK